jgi:hypothetical protein
MRLSCGRLMDAKKRSGAWRSPPRGCSGALEPCYWRGRSRHIRPYGQRVLDKGDCWFSTRCDHRNRRVQLEQLNTFTIGRNIPQSRDFPNGRGGCGSRREMGTSGLMSGAGERTRQGRSRAAGAVRLVGQTSSTGLSSLASGSPKPTKAHPCTGALQREHSHFFNQSGQFGSLDWLGGQVDDGPYRIINDNTVYIGSAPAGATFHYRILHGDTLMLSPVLTKAMLRQALAHPQKFSAAGWAVSVAYAGDTWKRVPCQSWC